MIVQKQTKNWDFEVLNPIETKKVVGGDWWRYIDEVVIPWDGTDWGDWWDGSGLYDPSNPYGNGGNDSGSGSSNNPDQNGFPEHICKQGANATTCATNALSYVANYFGAAGLTASDFAEMAGKDYFSMSTGSEVGLTTTQMEVIMNNVFNGITISDYQSLVSQVSSGNPIIAGIDGSNGIDGHVVVITCADSAGNIQYMDSVTGGVVNTTFNNVNFMNDFVAITGVKDNNYVNQYKNDANDVSFCSICGR